MNTVRSLHSCEGLHNFLYKRTCSSISESSSHSERYVQTLPVELRSLPLSRLSSAILVDDFAPGRVALRLELVLRERLRPDPELEGRYARHDAPVGGVVPDEEAGRRWEGAEADAV